MRQITTVEAALELIETLEGIPDRTDIEEWQLQSWKLYRAGHKKSMEECFGLNVGPGEAHMRLCNRWRTQERNKLIREVSWRLRNDYEKTQRAKVIAHAMKEDIPNVEDRDARILLIKLRTICQPTVAGKPLAIGHKQTLNIMNGDGW